MPIARDICRLTGKKEQMSIESERRIISKALSKFAEIPYNHSRNDALDSLVYALPYIFREDNNMKKDSVADIEYKNAVDSLQNEAWEKKKAIDDDVTSFGLMPVPYCGSPFLSSRTFSKSSPIW